MTNAELAAVTAHNERFTALKKLVAAFEDQEADPIDIITMLQNRIDNIREKDRQDVIDDMADTLNTDREYRYSVASQLTKKMTDKEVGAYRALYLSGSVDDDYDEDEPSAPAGMENLSDHEKQELAAALIHDLAGNESLTRGLAELVDASSLATLAQHGTEIEAERANGN